MTGFGEVSEYLRRATVRVIDGRRSGSGGSGVVWNRSGTVLTNAHVVSGSTAVVETWSGDRFAGKVTRRDNRRDLCALQIDAQGLSPASIAGSAALRPGELVVAVGCPLGFVGAVSTGVVCAVGELPGSRSLPWVQSTVRLAPGNSGGPLANARGELIGINTMILAAGTGHSLSLAVPSDAAVAFLREPEIARRALGATLRPVSLPKPPGVGFLVLAVAPDGPAARASLFLGDLLIGANGRRFHGVSDFERALEQTATGRVTIQFLRGGAHERSATVLLDPERVAAA